MRKYLASLAMLLGLTAFIAAAEPTLREPAQAGAADRKPVSPGVVVSARVVVPEALRDGVNARLILRRDKSEIERPPFQDAPRGAGDPHGAYIPGIALRSNMSGPTVTG